ncbi:hypothetical protein [Granulicatella elegans]|nr:hypothetical protein [Granulicatella elegans]
MKLLDEIHAYQGKLTLEELNEKIQQTQHQLKKIGDFYHHEAK